MKIRFLIALILSGFISGAQDIGIRAAVDKSEVGQYETVRYAVVITGEGGGEFAPPNNLQEHFDITGGPYVERSYSTVNGRTTAYQKFSYDLRPKHMGEITLNPATIEQGSEIHNSNPVVVKVVDNPQPQYDENDPRAIAARMSDVRIIPTKLRVYEGESFGIAYKIYSKFRLTNIDVVSEPSYDGFLTEILEEDVQARNSEDENGQAQLEYNVRTYSMTATRDGLYEFDPYVVNIPTPVGNNRFSFRQQYIENIERAYHPDIEVIPLPTEGKPSSFSGAVGDLEFEVILSRNDVPVNESATIEIKIKGRGNLRSIELPELNLPDQLEVYAPKDEMDVQPTAYGPRGEVSRKYTIVPRYPGSYTVPSLEFVYFDPKKEEYIVIKSEEQEITSEGEAPLVSSRGTSSTPSRTPSNVDQRDVELLNEDIRWIRTSNLESGTNTLPFYTRGWFIGGMGGSAILAAWLLFAGSFKRWSRARYNAIKAEGRVALNTLKKSNDWRELNLALSNFLEKGMGVSKADQIEGKLQAKLEVEGVTNEDANEVYSLLVTCEAGQYGQASMEVDEAKSNITNWIQKQL